MEIKFSIIIPHYNIPSLLVRCIRSIPERVDIQVIVVDDNSPEADGYLDRYVELRRSNVEWILTSEGRGAGYARNVGLVHAKGRWLIFADADDFFTPDLEKILDEFCDSKDDILYFNTRSCLSDDISIKAERTKNFMFEQFKEHQDDKKFRFGYTEPWGKMIRRSFVEEHQIRFDETKVSNDYLFSVMTGYYAKTIKIVNLPFYVYTVRQNSLTSDDGTVHVDKLLARFNAYAHVQAFMESKGFHSVPALTSHILVPLFKNYRNIYNQNKDILRNNKLSVARLYRDTILHYLYKMIGKSLKWGDVYSIEWK